MSTDAARPEPTAPSPDLKFLPEVVSLEIARKRYRKPRIYAVGPTLKEATQAIEITIETAEPIPDRALGPALIIGGKEITDAEQFGKNAYRFYVFDPTGLKPDAPISLGWIGQRRPRQRTRFRFSLPDQ